MSGCYFDSHFPVGNSSKKAENESLCVAMDSYLHKPGITALITKYALTNDDLSQNWLCWIIQVQCILNIYYIYPCRHLCYYNGGQSELSQFLPYHRGSNLTCNFKRSVLNRKYLGLYVRLQERTITHNNQSVYHRLGCKWSPLCCLCNAYWYWRAYYWRMDLRRSNLSTSRLLQSVCHLHFSGDYGFNSS